MPTTTPLIDRWSVEHDHGFADLVDPDGFHESLSTEAGEMLRNLAARVAALEAQAAPDDVLALLREAARLLDLIAPRWEMKPRGSICGGCGARMTVVDKTNYTAHEANCPDAAAVVLLRSLAALHPQASAEGPATAEHAGGAG